MLLKNKGFIVFIIIIILAAIVYFIVDLGFLSCFNPKPVPGAREEELSIQYEEIITINTGEEINITLESNPTTGYQWQVGYDSVMLELVNQEFLAPEDTDLVGVGGEEVFEFKALELGESEITFLYLRPWETDVDPERVLYYKVIVE